jgi:ABC-2 type transport system permease protein
MGIAQSVVYLVVGLVAGVDVRSGVGGALVLLVLATVIVLGFGGLGMLFALRTGSGEAVQGLFPLLFIMLFLSSMALPRHLIEQDWFRIVATINPVSYLIEGMRSLIVEGWNGEALALGFGIATVIAVLGLAGASIALRGRLTRT